MPLNEDQANTLAKAIQAAVPFTSRPFHALAEELGLGPGDVLAQLAAWKAEGKLREISAVLEGSALGYESALVAATVSADDLDRVVAVVNAHPTVTHDYLRDHDLNLWFTIAVPEQMGLDRTLRLLETEAGVACFHALRRTAVFKIGVRFDLKSKLNETTELPAADVARLRPTDREIRMFRALQAKLPFVERPFEKTAADAGVPEEELLDFGRRHLGGAVRRYVGTFRHRRLGVAANGMVVWRVAPEDEAALGHRLAAAPEVSHCYARNSVPGFPYTVYSMVHGPDQEACRAIARRLSRETGHADHHVLFSTREFKKVRLRYFLPALDQWWADRVTKEVSHAG